MLVTASGLWDASGNPASNANDGNTGTSSACEGATGYCAIASDWSGGQAVGNYLQIDLGAVMSVKSVTVYGRRDTALSQGRNLNLKTSSDGTSWTTTFMADATSPSGFTVSTATVARYVRVETTSAVYLSLYEIVVTGSPYVDCGTSCSDLALNKTATASGLWSPDNPASKVNDGNTGTTSACEGAAGYCAIASDPNRNQAIGNFLQIDLGAVVSVKSVTVYGRRDAALSQGQNLNLRLSTDGTSWSTWFMADTTSPSGYTVNTTAPARYVRVETTTVVYLSLYEIVVTGFPSTTLPYVDCGSNCANLALGKTVSASGLWDAANNPAWKANDGNSGANPACEGAGGYCAIASDPNRNQAIGNYLQVDLGAPMSVKSVTVYGRRDAALTQGQNLNLKLSRDGTNWTTTYMMDTTSPSGLTVSTTAAARYVRVETTTVVYLSLYEIVVTGTTSTGAQLEGPQSNPCVPDVPAAFARLRHYGDTIQISHNGLASDYTQPVGTTSHHFQGIQRLRAPGNYVAISGADPADLFIGVMGSRNPTPGSPWSSNYLTNLANDKLLSRTPVTGAPHAGGLSVIGDVLAVPLQWSGTTQVVFYDVSNPTSIVRLPPVLSSSNDNLGAVAITKLQNGQFLLGAHDSLSPQTLDWYLSTGTDLSATGWTYQSRNVLIAGYQNINLINQCDGHVYMAASFDQAFGGGWLGDDRRLRLYDIAMSGTSVTNVGQIMNLQMQCGTDGCEFAAASGTYVAPNGNVFAYSSRGFISGDHINFVEFEPIPPPAPVSTTNDSYVIFSKDAGMNPDVQSMAIHFYDPNWYWYHMNDGFGYGSLDNQISSMVYSIPESHSLVLFDGPTLGGAMLFQLSGPGSYDNLANLGVNDRIESAWLHSKSSGFIHFFDGANFTNKFPTNFWISAGAQYSNLSVVGMNNNISSIRYQGAPGIACELYHDINFVNKCGTIGDTGGVILERATLSTGAPAPIQCADNQISSIRCARIIILP
ncbi:MAG TPA: discoidin domain-containing protein [Candidatus Polarisedimenticolia bacterium]|nr:discoidin domain-containing protein [Candidatus Polarisedimenticolia bacterium]